MYKNAGFDFSRTTKYFDTNLDLNYYLKNCILELREEPH